MVKLLFVFHSSPPAFPPFVAGAVCSVDPHRSCVYRKEVCVGSKAVGVALIVTGWCVEFVRRSTYGS